MIKYSSYLLKNILSKWTTWIVLILAAITVFLVTYLQIHEITKYKVAFVNSVNTFTKMVPFIFGVSFMSIVIVNVFKEGEEDGTELLVVSKPISRTQIIFGKFFVVFVALLLFSSLMLFLELATAQFDTYASKIDRVNFALSISVGGMIVMAIATVIIMLISSFIGKVGTISIGIVTAATVPIASTILSQVSQGSPRHLDSKSYEIINQKQVDELVAKDIEKMKLHEKITIEPGEVLGLETRTLTPYKLKDMKKYNDYINKRWYQYAVYGDIWYQWNTFYEMFSGKSMFGIGETFNAEVINQEIDIPDEYALETINGKNVTVPVSKFSASEKTIQLVEEDLLRVFTRQAPVQTLMESDFTNNVFVDILANRKSWKSVPKAEILDYFISSTVRGNTITFEDQIRAVQEINAKDQHDLQVSYLSIEEFLLYKAIIIALNDKDTFIDDYGPDLANLALEKYKQAKTDPVKADELKKIITPTLYTSLGTMTDANIKSMFISNLKSTLSTLNYVAPTKIYGYADPSNLSTIKSDPEKLEAFELTEAPGIMVDGATQRVLIRSRFIDRSTTLTIWGSIGGLLLLITIIRYFRRDFK